MKKKIIVALFSLIALLIINPYKSITAKADAIAVDLSYEITAVSKGDGKGGNAFLFTEYEQTAEEVVISFDMIQNVQSGYFGVVFTSKMSVGDFLNKDNLILFGKNNEQMKSEAIAKSSDFTFERGYNYIVTYSRSKKKLTIGRSLFGKNEYKEVFKTSLKLSTGICGLAAVTTNDVSARVLIDNLKITEGDKTLIDSNFDTTESIPNLTARFTENSYAKIADEFVYKIVFLNENGDYIEERQVGIHDYAECSIIPENVPTGKYFAGWDKMVSDVTYDSVVRVKPVFDDIGNKPNDSSSDDSKTNEGQGCQSVVSVSCGGLMIFLFSIVGLMLKRSKKQ